MWYTNKKWHIIRTKFCIYGSLSSYYYYFLEIWTRKYVYIWNLTCTWSDTIRPCQKINRNAQGGQILNFQYTFDRACDEIKMRIQTENFFRSLISTRFILGGGGLLISLRFNRLQKYFCEVSPACRYNVQSRKYLC